jgi:hypothetical protein
VAANRLLTSEVNIECIVKKTCRKSKLQAPFPLKKMFPKFEKGLEEGAKERPGERSGLWKKLLIIA